MNLSDKLLKDFGTLLKDASDKGQTKPDTTVYGTITRKTDGQYFVTLDGSDVETPVEVTTQAEVDDRVLIMIKNHKAVVTGNISAPVNARATDRYLKFTNAGLQIGTLDASGNPTGMYLLLSGDTYYIKDQSGNTLASFAASEFQLLYGNGTIKVDNQTLYLLGRVAAGLRAEKPSDTLWKAEVAVKCDPGTAPGWEDDDNPAAGIQVLYDGVPRASIVVNKDGCFANGEPIGIRRVYEQQYELTNGSAMTSLTTLGISFTLDAPPTGYRWEGISGILIDLGRYVEDSPGVGHVVWNNNQYSDDNKYVVINSASIDPTTRRVFVSITTDSMFGYIGYHYVKLLMLCFALPISNVTSGETKYIEF